MRSSPHIIAHRGNSRFAPENTLAAFKSAAACGAGWIELDIQRTADGKLVCLHDYTLERTTNVSQRFPGRERAPITEFTAAEIARLDAGMWFDPRFAGERVPELRDVIRLPEIASGTLGLVIEVKDAPLYRPVLANLLQMLVQELRIAGLPNPARAYGGVIVESFYPEVLHTLRRVAPDIARVQLVPPIEEIVPRLFNDFAAAIALAQTYAIGMSVPLEDAHEGILLAIDQAGLDTFVWTVNDQRSMRRLAKLNVSGIITDDPRLALECLISG